MEFTVHRGLLDMESGPRGFHDPDAPLPTFKLSRFLSLRVKPEVASHKKPVIRPRAHDSRRMFGRTVLSFLEVRTEKNVFVRGPVAVWPLLRRPFSARQRRFSLMMSSFFHRMGISARDGRSNDCCLPFVTRTKSLLAALSLSTAKMPAPGTRARCLLA